MPRTISLRDAARDFAALIAAVRAGGEVVIADGDTPLARLAPLEHTHPLNPSAVAAAALLEEPLPSGWRCRSTEKIEAQIAEEQAAWD
jgi:antitoxin (DNA-binding transcriptional repressor) of toxin-antitoxin stability system